jgi:hypothetical protein
MFYHGTVHVEYREEPCKVALNRVKGMPFNWSLNPYMGCVHRCTFCYVRAFERRADRPSDDRYGSSIRVKTNVADVLRSELARPSWEGAPIAIGAATDPYQPAEGRYRLTRACLEVLRDAAQPFSLITRGPMIVRDAELLAEASRLADVSVTFSVRRSTVTCGGRPSPGRLRRSSGCARSPCSCSTASVRQSEWRRCSPASPTTPIRSAASSPRHARPVHAASGRTSST